MPHPSLTRSYRKTESGGELQCHKHPDDEANSGQNGEYERVGEVVVHGQLHVVLPQPEGTSRVDNGREDPVEDERVQEKEEGQGHH